MIERINEEGYYLVQFPTTSAVAIWDEHASHLKAASTQSCGSRSEEIERSNQSLCIFVRLILGRCRQQAQSAQTFLSNMHAVLQLCR